jgi:two-component system nitrogen regulation response regulator NtrX
MVTLAIEGNGGSELTYHLGKSTISVGASSQNDVVIRAPGVAPRHLVIQRNGDVHTFITQNRQVVVLNGERRSRGVLRVGDRIRMGTTTLIFKGVGEDDVAVAEAADEAPATSTAAPKPTPMPPADGKRRAEVVLYSEPNRLAEARRHIVEIFKSGVQADLVAPIRTFLESFFDERQAMIAYLDQDGRFEPVVSQWTGEVPRLPARTFDELRAPGRYAVLHLAGRRVVIHPIERGALQSLAYLLVEVSEEDAEDDLIVAELARVLAIQWDRLERSGSLLGGWEATARGQLEEELPGTSQAIKVLRDGLLDAAPSIEPVLLCGRTGSGRMSVAMIIASINPTGPLPVQVFQAREADEETLRGELFGPESAKAEERVNLVDRARNGVLLLRDVHLLPTSLQRELVAGIQYDRQSGYGPSVRWIATTGEDAMGLLNEGMLDPTLYHLMQSHMLRVPSLSERREDLPLLIVRLITSLGAEQGKEIRGIELETLNSLVHHTFDGEMTELIAELRRLVSATADGEMVRGLVPVRPRSGAGGGGDDGEPDAAALVALDDLKVVIPSVERMIIDRVLRRTMGNQSKAARVLNLSRGALISKIKEYEIPDYRYLRRSR